MKAEQLFDAIGDIEDEFILRSGLKKKKKRKMFQTYGTVMISAACLALIFGIGWFVTEPLTELSKPPVSTEDTQASEGFGPLPYDPENPQEYEEYWLEDNIPTEHGIASELEWVDFNPGAIMPMTLAQADDDITAKRTLTYDFDEVLKENKGIVPVTDNYEINNISDSDKAVTVYYPYMTSVKQLAEKAPHMTIDGQNREITVTNGAYMGYDSNNVPTVFAPNISVDEHFYMIDKAEPMTTTLDDRLLNQTAFIYEFENLDSGEIPADIATYQIRFKVNNPDNVYTAHTFSQEYDGEYLTVKFGYSDVINKNPAVFFLGEKPTECLEQGYSYFDTKEKYQSDEVTANMVQRQMTVKEILYEQMEQQLVTLDGTKQTLSAEMTRLYYERVAQMFCDMYRWNNDGVTTDEDDVFYENSISDIAHMAYDYDALYVLKDTVTIPKKESIIIELSFDESGSYQMYEPQEKLRDNYCYDNMPSLNTNINFQEQRAVIEESGNIRIEDQNYGFDLEKGIKEVLLELDAERYYMIVKLLK